ncbi:MAG: hypothetical protein Q4D13_00210 [Erysipelotrichaceae bacterium]|nr:hypothetical protein [Erysipelotrichaceae bacterium]
MLKGLSDYASLFTLVFAVIYALRICVWAFVNPEVSEKIYFFELFKDYLNNEDE